MFPSTIHIVSHAIAFLTGAGGVFVYLHKHTTNAIAAANTLAATVAQAKADLQAAKAIAAKTGA